MSDLRDAANSLGCERTKTLLQSGNLIFQRRGISAMELENQFELALEDRYGYHIEVVIRTSDEWRSLIEVNPLPDEAKRDPGHLVVTFLKDEVASARKSIVEAWEGPEVIRAIDRQLYIYFPTGIGNSSLTNARLEKLAGSRVTGRNWNTVTKLNALLDP